jgi:hypothetical protein
VAPLTNDSVTQAVFQAKGDAEQDSAIFWGIVGAAAAGVLAVPACLICAAAGGVTAGIGPAACGSAGCAGATASGYLITPDVPVERLTNHSPAYQKSYTDEYQSDVRFKHARNAFIGGIIVTAVLTLTAVILANSLAPKSGQ